VLSGFSGQKELIGILVLSAGLAHGTGGLLDVKVVPRATSATSVQKEP